MAMSLSHIFIYNQRLKDMAIRLSHIFAAVQLVGLLIGIQ